MMRTKNWLMMLEDKWSIETARFMVLIIVCYERIYLNLPSTGKNNITPAEMNIWLQHETTHGININKFELYKCSLLFY